MNFFYKNVVLLGNFILKLIYCVRLKCEFLKSEGKFMYILISMYILFCVVVKKFYIC